MVILEKVHERGRSQPRSKGFSLIELMIVVAIILIIAALAIPNFLQAKMQANQGAAASTVRSINTGVAQYSAAWSNGFPPSLAALGSIAPIPSCNGAAVLDGTLTNAPNQKSGYTFSYTPQGALNPSPPAGCAPGSSAYLVTAVPNNSFTGTLSYCSDESMVLHYNSTGAAIPSTAACEALPVMQ